MPELTAVRCRYGLLLLVAVALPLSEGLKNIAFALLLLLALITRQWRGGAWLRQEPLTWGLLAYLSATALATLMSPEPLASAKGLLDVFRFTSLWFLVAHGGLSRAQVRGTLWAVWGGLAAGAIAALPGLVAGRYRYLQIFSLGQFNHTAIYLALAIIPLLALVLLRRERGERTGLAPALLLGVLSAALLLTASRAAWGGVAVMAIVLAARSRRNRRLMGLLLLLALLAGAAGSILLEEGPWHALKNKFRTAQSLHMRLGIWKNALRGFAEHPVLGTGPERFTAIFPAGYDSSAETHAPHGHSVYVQAAVTTGTVGLAALLFLLATALHSWWRQRDLQSDNDWSQVLWYGAGGGILVVAGIGLLNTTLHHEHGMLFALLLGLAVAWKKAPAGPRLLLASSDFRTESIARVADELARALTDSGCTVAMVTVAAPPATFSTRLHFTLRVLTALATDAPAGCIALQWRPEGRAARLARRWLGIPYLVYLHGKEAVPASGSERRLLRAVLAAATGGIAVSRATAAAVQAAVGGVASIEVVPNGVTAAAWTLPAAEHRERIVLACGRLVPRKGFAVLVRAMGELRDCGWRLVIIGDGPQRDELAGLARSHGFDPAAVLPGSVDDAALWLWYRRAGIFVMPSQFSPEAFEGLGIALLEAAAAGLPLVGTDAGGIPEIIRDGENGRLVPPGDVPALAAALRALMDDDVLRTRLGTAAQLNARGFDWRAIACRLQRMLEATT